MELRDEIIDQFPGPCFVPDLNHALFALEVPTAAPFVLVAAKLRLLILTFHGGGIVLRMGPDDPGGHDTGDAEADNSSRNANHGSGQKMLKMSVLEISDASKE